MAGQSFAAAVSPDGVSWTQVGTTTAAVSPNGWIGLAVTSHDPGALNTAMFDSAEVSQQTR
jgi:hypothetical protein